MTEKFDIATRDEALALLTEQARKGSPTAAAALARELRRQEADDDQPLNDELESLIKSNKAK